MLAAAVIFLAWCGREVYLAYTATPGARVDYFAKLSGLVESGWGTSADGADAWPLLAQAIDLQSRARDSILTDDPEERAVPLDYSVIGWTRRPDGEDPPMYDARHTMAEVEAKARRAMAALRDGGFGSVMARAAVCPRASFPAVIPSSGRVMDIQLTSLGPVRNLARINRSRMIIAGETGDDAEFLAAFEQTLALARLTAHQGLLIDYLVGVAIHALALSELRFRMVARGLDASVLAAALEAMERHPLPPSSLAIDAERLCMLDAIQWVHTDNGRGDGRLILSEFMSSAGAAGGPGTTGFVGRLSASPLINLAGIAFAGKAATTRRAEAYFDGMNSLARLDRWRRTPEVFDAAAFERGLSRRYLMLRSFLAPLPQTLGSIDVLTVERTGTRLMASIELFRARTGACPASLDQLVPEFITAVPIDPINGKPFVYRVLAPGEDRWSRPYLLYSAGADGVDDGGRHAANPRNTLQPGRAGGFDYVFNLPRGAELDAPDSPPPAPPP